MKTIVIAGGNGFIGNGISQHFLSKGFKVIVLTRSPKTRDNGIQELLWDAKTLGEWANSLDGADLLINLTGKSVNCNYTEKNKTEIFNSRIDSTRLLQKAVEQCATPPHAWFNASTATIYCDSRDRQMTEANGIIGADFSMTVAKEWEHAFFETPLPKTRKVALRMSMVLDNSGGVLPVLKRLVTWRLGGRMGDGQQKFAHVKLDELLHMIDFLLEHTEIEGAVNCTSNQIITNEVFMKKLRESMGIRCYLNHSKWMLRLGSKLLQTETELILKSRCVYPERLEKAGFNFDKKLF